MSAYVGSSKNLKDLKEAIPLNGGPDVIRKEARPFCRTRSGVHLCRELKEPQGPKGPKAAGENARQGGAGFRVQGLGFRV